MSCLGHGLFTAVNLTKTAQVLFPGTGRVEPFVVKVGAQPSPGETEVSS